MEMRKTLLCLFLSTLPGFAQEGWRVEVQLVRLGEVRGKLDYLMAQDQWNQQLKSGEVLDAGSTLMPLTKEVDLYLGRKYPITYFDPRAGMTQVNYVDVGFKASLTPKVLDDGRVQVDCFLLKRALFDEKLPLPTMDNFSCYSTLLLKPGQVAVAAMTRGMVGTRYLAGLFPGRTFSDKDTFVWTVSARKL